MNLKKVLKNVFLLICLLFVILFIFARSLGFKPMIVVSGSMEPTIPTGSLVISNPNYEYEDVKIGDIVIFENSSMDVIHRVVEKADDNSGYITKGDNNDIIDGVTVTENTLKGSLLFSIPYVGYLISFINNGYVKIIICFIILYLFIDTFMSIFIKDENDKENKNSKDEIKDETNEI